ncbi:MAG TPA: hypothetical protein VEB43_05135 [Anaeromyxobacter sp.]|nr:hypothetical protein [Anaeromyxobacter sp.]
MTSPSTVRRTVFCAMLTAALACATGGARPGGGSAIPPASQDPASVLERFVEALEAGRWSHAHGMLSARWRASYTPARLAADYGGAGPLAREAVAHVRSALAARAPLQVADGQASLPVAGGRAVLVAEAAGWRVDRLE